MNLLDLADIRLDNRDIFKDQVTNNPDYKKTEFIITHPGADLLAKVGNKYTEFKKLKPNTVLFILDKAIKYINNMPCLYVYSLGKSGYVPTSKIRKKILTLTKTKLNTSSKMCNEINKAIDVYTPPIKIVFDNKEYSISKADTSTNHTIVLMDDKPNTDKLYIKEMEGENEFEHMRTRSSLKKHNEISDFIKKISQNYIDENTGNLSIVCVKKIIDKDLVGKLIFGELYGGNSNNEYNTNIVCYGKPIFESLRNKKYKLTFSKSMYTQKDLSLIISNDIVLSAIPANNINYRIGLSFLRNAKIGLSFEKEINKKPFVEIT